MRPKDCVQTQRAIPTTQKSVPTEWNGRERDLFGRLFIHVNRKSLVLRIIFLIIGGFPNKISQAPLMLVLGSVYVCLICLCFFRAGMFDHNPFVLGVQIEDLWKSFGLDDVFYSLKG